MKIYLDYNIGFPLGLGWHDTLDAHIDDIPDGVDLIGLTFFHHNIAQIRSVVDLAIKKSKHVIIYFCEFNGPDVAAFEQEYHEKYPNLQIFANAVPHYPSRLQRIGEWFMRLDNPYSKEPWAMELLPKLEDARDRPYRFDCLLGKQTPARDFIAAKYRQCPTKDGFIFTYFKDNPRNGIWNEVEIDDDIVLSSNRIKYRDELISLSNILPVSIYNQSHYSIVSDTQCPSDFNFYTEKIAKPIIAGRLFVVFGSHLYLENLRKIGFQTFDDVIDESYDRISDSADRWEAAWQQVEFLLAQDPVIIKQRSQDIIEHNRRLMLDTDWAAPIKNHINRILFPEILDQRIV